MVEDGGRVRVHGAELYCEIGGEGRSLVLLHDGLPDRRVWDDRFVAFVPRYGSSATIGEGTVSRRLPTAHSQTFRTCIACFAT